MGGESPTGAARRTHEPAAAPLTRRQVLGRAGALLGLGTLGAAPALGWRLLARVPATQDLATAHDLAQGTRQWAFVIDLRRCDGCGECITACQRMHHLPETQEWIKVYELTDPTGQTYFMPVLCQLCQNAPCVRVCPVGATYYQENGAIVVDQDVCIGCRMCMAACPYGVRTFNWEDPPDIPQMFWSSSPEYRVPQRQGTVGKCTNCVHALEDGKFPACVEFCSMEALYVGDLVEDVATNGRETVVLSRFLRENDAFRFKDELGTEPRVYYIAGHGQDLGY